MDWISHTSLAPECTHTPTSPCVCIHPPLPVFAFTHLPLCLHSPTSPCVCIHPPPPVSAFTHLSLCLHSPTSPCVCIHPPPPVSAFTHLSLCMMAACVNRPCIFAKRSSSRVDRRRAIPSCTCRLPEKRMTFRNASTSLTISSLGWDNKGITWEKKGIKNKVLYSYIRLYAMYEVHINHKLLLYLTH